MRKYIDVEKLVTIIEERKAQQDQWINRYHDPINQGISYELTKILSIIESLQQKQNSIQDTELTVFESALFTAFSYAWQSYLKGEEVNVIQWVKENSAELLEAARFQQEQPEVELEKEIERIVKNEEKFMKFQVRHQLIGYVARYFYELGLNARKK